MHVTSTARFVECPIRTCGSQYSKGRVFNLLLHLPLTWFKIVISNPEMSTSVFSLLLFPLGNLYQLSLTQIIPSLENNPHYQQALLDHTLLTMIQSSASIHWRRCVVIRCAGAGFVISHFKTEKAFRDGKEYSMFTAELCAMLMASSHLVDLPCRLRLCLSYFAWSLLALNNADQFRSDIIFEIKYIIHC